MVAIREALSGGNPRSLAGVDDIVTGVLADQALLPALMAGVLDTDPVIRMRAGDALEKVCRHQPTWLEPHAEWLLNEAASVNQASVRWHVAQMLGRIDLSERDRTRAVALLMEYLGASSDWLVLNHAMDALAVFARHDPRLRPRLLTQLNRLQGSRLRSVSRRATKLHREFAGERKNGPAGIRRQSRASKTLA